MEFADAAAESVLCLPLNQGFGGRKVRQFNDPHSPHGRCKGGVRCHAGLIFRLLTPYRPGGESEKVMILKELRNAVKYTDAGKAAEGLRAWFRWLQRADNVSVAKPDPSILARGLTNMTVDILRKNPEAMFRTSLVKSSIQVDTIPTMTTVLEYHRHLTSEMEVLQTSPRKGERIEEGQEGAKLRALERDRKKSESWQAAGEKRKKKKKQCRYFAKDDAGPRQGAKCPFEHAWDTTSKKGRCLLCSAVGHLQKDCPSRDGARDLSRSPDGGADTAKGEGKDKVKGAASMLTTTKGPPSSTPTSPTTSTASQVAEARGSNVSPDLKELLNETTQVLKSMMTAPQPKQQRAKLELPVTFTIRCNASWTA